jgi:hypothetical protein
LEPEFSETLGDEIGGELQTWGLGGSAFEVIGGQIGDIGVDPFLSRCLEYRSFGHGVFIRRALPPEESS